MRRWVVQADIDGGVRSGVTSAELAEIKKLKAENRPYKTIADIDYATMGWVDWYNNRHLHSTIDYVPPAEFEQAHYAALSQQEQPA